MLSYIMYELYVPKSLNKNFSCRFLVKAKDALLSELGVDSFDIFYKICITKSISVFFLLLAVQDSMNI